MQNRDSTRRDFMKAAGLGAASLAVSSRLQMAGAAEAGPTGGGDGRPNIILILVDDMGYSDLGCYGSEIRTPNLDRLAGDGLRFSQFYNAARCCPTRASLLTGLYPHQAGMGGMISRNPGAARKGSYQGYLNDRCVTIAEALKAAGYRTFMSGKWHVGEKRPYWPTDRGFEKYSGLISGGANYFDITKTKGRGVKRTMAVDDKPYSPPREGFYMTDAITDHAVEFLEASGRGGKPFLLYVAYTAPHWPLHALPEDIERYRGKYRGGWDKLRQQRYERMTAMGLIDKKWPLTPRDEGSMPWEDVKDKEAMDLKMAVYAAQIDRMDQGIGRIMAKLKELGKESDTLVMFLSDNGGCAEGGTLGFDRRNNGLPPGGVNSYMSYGLAWANASNTPFRLFKKWTHEGGIATPLIAHWPAAIKQAGAITHQPGHIIDVMDTCLDVAGARYPESHGEKETIPLEGKSLLPVLRGGRREPHEFIYWEHMRHEAVRHGKWKLAAKTPGQWELYDLEEDRSETTNLADKYPELLARLSAKYVSWAKRWQVRK